MWRAYFISGDLLACTVTGAGAAWLVQAAVPADWFMVLGMLAGMALGICAGIVGAVVFTPLFGSLEVMLPVSLSAMVAGTGVGITQAMAREGGGLGSADAVLGGAVAALACLAYTYVLQARVSGEVNIPEAE